MKSNVKETFHGTYPDDDAHDICVIYPSYTKIGRDLK
jgi:hypothetical protein